jgi:hypothetical protein
MSLKITVAKDSPRQTVQTLREQGYDMTSVTASPKNSWAELTLGVALVAFMTACLFGFMIANNNSDLVNYRKMGIETTAEVIAKSRTREGTKKVLVNHVELIYFAGEPLAEDTRVVITRITKFVTDDLWEKLEAGDSVTVLYLPEDPENNTILKDSLSALESQWYLTFLPSLFCGGIGIFLVILSMKLYAWKI